MIRVIGGCIDCEPGSRRPTTRPGPRCATHQRIRRQIQRSANHAKHILVTYGITAEEYQAIYEAQGGCCYICQRAKGNARKRLSVDHDHATGEVRGLLCTPCNQDVLGHLRDSREALQRAVDYLAEPPARSVLHRMRKGI